MRARGALQRWVSVMGVVALGGATVAGTQPGGAARPALIPWPAEVTLEAAGDFTITTDTVIVAASDELRPQAEALSSLLAPAMDGRLKVAGPSGAPSRNVIRLDVSPSAIPGSEAYELRVTGDAVQITGGSPAGVFYGLQTLRQLLPPSVEYRGARPHAVSVAAVRVADRPRFEWRGAMLVVARHFFDVAAVKRYIDLLALHKFNRLHLHLSDDQGWRVEISRWPNLTKHGGSTAVGGGHGGFYTKRDYQALVAYASERFVTVVPEIDMPSHINAALASYPELNCDGKAPPLYTGIDVGFSAFYVEKPVTYKFIDDVVGELAAMTPGPYIHIGGDEVKTLTPQQYQQFMERAQAVVVKHGKQPVGWDEIVHAKLQPATVVQYWRPDASITPPAGTRLILSPANRIYLDMKYDDRTGLGLNWAGNVAVDVPYNWDPATLLPPARPEDILGIEAPIWSETLTTMDGVEFMAFPRIAGVAEVAWSPQAVRDWAEFRTRLGAQGPRWSALGISAFRSPAIAWK